MPGLDLIKSWFLATNSNRQQTYRSPRLILPLLPTESDESIASFFRHPRDPSAQLLARLENVTGDGDGWLVLLTGTDGETAEWRLSPTFQVQGFGFPERTVERELTRDEALPLDNPEARATRILRDQSRNSLKENDQNGRISIDIRSFVPSLHDRPEGRLRESFVARNPIPAADSVIIGEFEVVTFQPFFSGDRTTIFTESDLITRRLLKGHEHVSIGDTIVGERRGGHIRLKNGRVLSVATPGKGTPRPGQDILPFSGSDRGRYIPGSNRLRSEGRSSVPDRSYDAIGPVW